VVFGLLIQNRSLTRGRKEGEEKAVNFDIDNAPPLGIGMDEAAMPSPFQKSKNS